MNITVVKNEMMWAGVSMGVLRGKFEGTQKMVEQLSEEDDGAWREMYYWIRGELSLF